MLKWERKEAGSRGGQGCRLPAARGAWSKQEGLAAPWLGGFGGVEARALPDLRSLGAQGFHAGETEAERSCGLRQVTQQAGEQG